MKGLGTCRLETKRLILRRFTMEDAADMYNNWASDAEVTKYLTWPPHSSLEVTKMLLSDWILKYENDNYFNWAIEYKETGRVIGNISVVKLNEAISAADMGYCMSRSLWGKGIMPEALTVVIDYLLNEVGLNRVAACHAVENPKSGRVMDKSGMKLDGVLRQAGRNNQGICDEVWYSIIKSDIPRE